jgi:hypothetical protein
MDNIQNCDSYTCINMQSSLAYRYYLRFSSTLVKCNKYSYLCSQLIMRHFTDALGCGGIRPRYFMIGTRWK